MTGVERVGYSPARWLLIAAAAVALLVALTVAGSVGPLAAGIDAVVELAGYDYVIAAGLGVLAVLAGLGALISGREATMETTEMPTVERPVPVPAAGEPFDERVGSWRIVTPLFGGADTGTVRKRLETAASTTIAAAEGCSRREAERRIAAGTWTDDHVAAAFLAGERTRIGTWLTAVTHRETALAFRVRRTVGAILVRRHTTPAGRPRTPTRPDEPSPTESVDRAESDIDRRDRDGGDRHGGDRESDNRDGGNADEHDRDGGDRVGGHPTGRHQDGGVPGGVDLVGDGRDGADRNGDER